MLVCYVWLGTRVYAIYRKVCLIGYMNMKCAGRISCTGGLIVVKVILVTAVKCFRGFFPNK